MIDYKIEFHGDGTVSIFRDGIGHKTSVKDLWAASTLMRELVECVITNKSSSFDDVISIMADVSGRSVDN